MGPPLFADTAEGEGDMGGVVVEAAARNRVGSPGKVGTGGFETERAAPTEARQLVGCFQRLKFTT